jgi:2-isopropylmalate synthase
MNPSEITPQQPERRTTAPEPGKYLSWADRFSDFKHTNLEWLRNPTPEKIRILETGLRDGDQALETPMTLQQRIKYFEGLLKQGFVEIETGYPAASKTNRDFTRLLIEEKRIPEGVLQQVLVAGRNDLIEKTFEALKGAPPTIVHVYVPTSEAQRNVVFNQTKDQVMRHAVESTKLVRQLANKHDLNIVYQFSPESFSETDPYFALAVCNAVVDAWDPKGDEKIILNLPATVEVCDPVHYGTLIDFIRTNLKRRDQVVISIHPHNDRGTATAAAEYALKAGAERIEGTLFGNGERAGNLDLLQIAANRLAEGLDPQIRLDNGPEIVDMYETCTGQEVPERHPVYSKKSYVAFSGTHQNAIHKYLTWLRETSQKVWTGFPYLLRDPRDTGYTFDNLIVVNQNSGKNGVLNIMKENFNLDLRLPNKLKEFNVPVLEEFAKIVQGWCDREGVSMTPQTMWKLFADNYITPHGPLELKSYTKDRPEGNPEATKVHLELVVNGGRNITVTGIGNGTIDAAVAALKEIDQSIEVGEQVGHSRGKGSNAEEVVYLEVSRGDVTTFSVGIDSDIERANMKALIAGVNRLSWAGA